MIVRIVKDWSFPDIMRQTPSHSCEWNGIKFTEEKIKECDVLVVLNRPHEKINCKVRKGGVWLFSQESPIPIYNWHLEGFPYFDKVYTFWNDISFPETEILHDQTALPWHIGKSYDELKKLKPGGLKKDKVSWVTSNASSKEGHKLRMSFLDYLKNQDFDFDLYGRGFQSIDDKFDGIFPYKYSLAIENYSCNDYWTEKLADCFLSWTLPFYYGCKNVLDYFPKDSIVFINPENTEEALATIKKCIENNEWEKRLKAIEEARNLILDKYQFFPSIVEKINKMKLSNHKHRKYIPAIDKKGITEFSKWEVTKNKVLNKIGI